MRLGLSLSKASLFLIAAAALLPSPLMAQARYCSLPASVATPHPELPDDREPRRVVPIGGYTLAVSWSPEYCRTHRTDPRNAQQCGGSARKFGFTLHGLWPDGEGKAWPQYCAATGILPAATIRPMLCTTPSAQLVQHEWAKHGTCMAGETPRSYFARSSAIYRALRFPDIDRLSRRPLTVGDFARAFAARNRGMTADMVRVTVTKTGWLDELWLCRRKDFAPTACRADSGGARPSQQLRIWRGGR